MKKLTKEEMLQEYYENQQLIKELEAKNDELKEMMLEEMAENETDTIVYGNLKAMSKTVKSSRFDSKAFKVDHEDLYNEYLKQGFQTRFTVNALKK